MILNHKNKKIIEYFKLKNMYRYEAAYLQFLGTGKKLTNQHFKILLVNIEANNFLEFEKNIFEIFSLFKIELTSSSLDRVKKHRSNLKKRGFKNISISLPGTEYDKLKKLKVKNNMTYSELISFLIDKNALNA